MVRVRRAMNDIANSEWVEGMGMSVKDIFRWNTPHSAVGQNFIT